MEIKSIVIKISVVAMFFSLIVLSGIYADWQEPASGPPYNNVDPPINTGTTTQQIAGNLWINTSNHWEVGLVNYGDMVAVGDILPFSDDTYSLGTSTLAWKDISFNKGYFTTLDPIYKINNKKYATYVSDTVGLKAEVIGEQVFKGNNLIINLKNQPEGSDLWLFYKIIKKDTIVPFVSSQSPVSLYGYIDGSDFIIKTIGENNGDVKFSYRLVGERIDNIADSNLADDQNISLYTDIDKIK